MDKLTRYRNLIKSILSEYVEIDKYQPIPGVETLLIADEQRNHYQLFTLGWSQRRRVRNLRIYVRLIEGKFWIEHDLTEDGIATELLKAGVPKEDIVLAFQAPEMRPYTEFAAA